MAKREPSKAVILSTLVVIDELPDGTCLTYPVVEPQTVAAGSEGDALTELRLFLAEELATANAERLARFSIPEDAEPYETTVRLPHPEVPERQRVHVDVPVRAIVVPHGKARWVLVPALRHTVYVGADEDLDEVVPRELQRHADSLAPTPEARFAWFDHGHARIERISLPVELPSPLRDGTRALRKKFEDLARRRDAREILASVGQAMHDEHVLAGPPVVGRDAEARDLHALLSAEARRSVLLVGRERVGKSAVLRHWLRTEGAGRPVYATSGAQLVAGMSGLGQWQERVRRVLQAAETLDAVLYFDDLRDLFDQRGASGVDIPSAMKAALEEGRVRVVAELTPEAADLLASQREGFFGAFTTLRVEPFDQTASAAVLRARAAHVGGEHETLPQLTDEAQDAMLALSERYLPYRPFPGKAAELFDQVVRSVQRAGVVLDDEDHVRASDVYRLFSIQTGNPEFLLRDDRRLDRERLLARFGSRVVGQTSAVESVVDTLCVVKAGLQPSGKPLATFLFVGPTGVGKTELARALAEILYGDEERLIRFDMSEYADGLAAQRLIGGGGGREGLLTRKIREQPFAVVLLDEIEKANPAVFDLLLQVTGEGRLTDARGRTAYFQNAILIMTSNIGASHRRNKVGLGETAIGSDDTHYVDEVRRWFRPEFVGRLDRIVPFAALTEAEVRRIGGLLLANIERRRGLVDLSLSLEVTEAALNHLSQGGYDPVYGARALRRHLEMHLVALIADALPIPTPRGGTVHVRREEEPAAGEPLARATRGGLVADLLKAEANVGASSLKAMLAAKNLRRLADQWMDLPAIEAQREELQSVLATLSAPRSRRERERAGTELAWLQSRHARLQGPYETLQRVREEIRELEELLFLAWMEGEPLPDATDECAALQHAMRMGLLEVYLDLSPQHEVSVMLIEQDGGRSLEHWLLPLYTDVERRKWEVQVHVFKDPLRDDPAWPRERNWGPPRERTFVEEWLGRRERDRAVLLARIRGPHCGTLVATEAGLHRFFGVPPLVSGAHHRVIPVAYRFALEAEDWESPQLTPPAPLSNPLKSQCSRWTDERPGQKLPEGYVDIPLDQYWDPRNVDELCLRDLIRIDTSVAEDRGSLYRTPLDLAWKKRKAERAAEAQGGKSGKGGKGGKGKRKKGAR